MVVLPWDCSTHQATWIEKAVKPEHFRAPTEVLRALVATAKVAAGFTHQVEVSRALPRGTEAPGLTGWRTKTRQAENSNIHR